MGLTKIDKSFTKVDNFKRITLILKQIKSSTMQNELESFNPKEITVLISQASDGSTDAMNNLISLVYDDLKIIAAGIRRKQFDVSKTINTTSLVNEAWLKINKYGVKAESRKHFFCIIAKAMQQVLINTAQQKLTNKRHAKVVTFDDSQMSSESEAQWILTLDEIIQSIKQSNQRMADVFQLKYFLGFSEDEISDTLGISKRSVSRDWLSARSIIKDVLAN